MQSTINIHVKPFTKNYRSKAKQTVGSCAVSERHQALQYWIRVVQGSEFNMELTSLSRRQTVKANSQLAGLNPFINEKRILRVGGRLKHSELAYDMKHPIILPKNHFFTTLIINQVHLHNLHSSLSVTMTILRQRYWIIHNRSSVKQVHSMSNPNYAVKLSQNLT
ncbi:uncharacterized protein LOC112604094 [Melanaphis sacchari]|uniref:uncharacterized protein LOC112604094 n=1 Tax=Melanaphis sacchari TaxID=742174 RepID=UPI000DC135E9|nr:uncharacterized protein LOC112604094 [Melanaphis sacchari]